MQIKRNEELEKKNEEWRKRMEELEERRLREREIT
ncbi:hypothetical protein RDI58_008834 [Solanum bulbocastanum]|uniref:Uncharacterized protein n=1 Tax=Solanum bulbocastanum TaxID=147425 RepID=A0AAN8U3A1_SOLBU